MVKGKMHWEVLRENSNQLLSYTADDYCSSPAMDYWFDSPNIYTAVLTGLVPGQTYHYRIGDSLTVREFKSAPLVDPNTKFAFATYGDMGNTHKSSEGDFKKNKCPGATKNLLRITQDVDEGKVNMVLHMGDIAYADGRQDEWDLFLSRVEPIASRVPYMVGVGNHEYDYKPPKTPKKKAKKSKVVDISGAKGPYNPFPNFGNDSGGECGVAVTKLFRMPGTMPDGFNDVYAAPEELGAGFNRSESIWSLEETDHESLAVFNQSLGLGGGMQLGARLKGPNAPFWYSFDYGSAHFTVVSTEHNISVGSDQYRWLKKDLMSVDRCKTPWLIVGQHRGLYVIYPHKSNRVSAKFLRKSVEKLYLKAEVDLVVGGHIHSYSRTCNVAKGVCVKEKDGGMVHATIGSGGRKISKVAMDRNPEWLDYQNPKDWGYGRVTVDGSKSILFEFVNSKNGKVLDHYKISNARQKKRKCPSTKRVNPDNADEMVAGFGAAWCGSGCQAI